ncbi:MAG TPA: tetratricopeptide repeat protein [Rudaea sp.]|nr:tetratricopeptide repeat protein [Rudaea sp.]
MSLLAELRRRNVIRMAGLYLVGAWLIVQVAGTLLPVFEAPAWVMKTLVGLLAVGFVPALIFSWVFELTPEGIKRDAEVKPEESIAPQTARRMDRTIIAVLAIALAFFAFDRLVLAPRRDAALVAATKQSVTAAAEAKPAIDGKSIAVLPFESLSDDKSNAYFAVGIQDEILTRLAKIGALKVISRTSTAHYASTPENLPEIARQLGVANILEGSVQKAGEAVHINVQLIRAATDEHLWAESYNRKLDDVFAVEGEVAQTIAEMLRATLSGAEVAQISARPTSNAAAYDAYLRGLDFERRTFGAEQLKAASKYFAQATQLDPQFAVAWAHGSDMDGLLYVQAFDHSDARLQAARRGAETAMRLAPESFEAWLAKGSFLYHIRDFDGAGAAFDEAARRQPNNPAVFSAQSYLERRRGHYERAIELMQRSLDRDPQNVTNLTGIGETLVGLGRYAAARVWYDRALTFRPGDPAVVIGKAGSWLAEGNLDAAGQLFEPLPLQLDDAPLLNVQVSYLLYRRRFGDAVKAYTAAMAAPDFALDGWTSSYYPALGWAQRWAGDEQSAHKTFAEGKRKLEALRATWNDNGYLSSNLAQIAAGLGDSDAAEREADHSLQFGGDDQYHLSSMMQNRVFALALAGRKDRALALLEAEMKKPLPFSAGDLRWSPYWDKLRDDPRFKKLLVDAEAAQTTQAKP